MKEMFTLLLCSSCLSIAAQVMNIPEVKLVSSRLIEVCEELEKILEDYSSDEIPLAHISSEDSTYFFLSAYSLDNFLPLKGLTTERFSLGYYKMDNGRIVLLELEPGTKRIKCVEGGKTLYEHAPELYNIVFGITEPERDEDRFGMKYWLRGSISYKDGTADIDYGLWIQKDDD